MKEDIKVLEELKEIFIHLKNYGWINDIKRDVDTDKVIQAIENLINRNKELLGTNLQLGELLKEDLYIPKSKVRKKIEELKQERKKQDEEDEIHLFYDQIDITNIIEVLEQLLQEGDK